MAGSRRTAARVTFGAICLSSSSHFALKLYSNAIKPIALPPGRAKLSTKPAPTGSAICVRLPPTLLHFRCRRYSTTFISTRFFAAPSATMALRSLSRLIGRLALRRAAEQMPVEVRS